MAAFGLPNFGQLTEAFKKAQQIQQDAQKLQEELDGMEIEGKSEDEKVRIWLSGNQKPIKVEINEELLKLETNQIEDSILNALTNAYETSTETMKNKMDDLTGGLNLNLPGMDDLNS